MNVRWSLRGAVVIILFAWFGSLPVEAQTYGGAATGATVTVPATGTVIRAATGTLSISGGGAEASVLVGDIPGSATGGVVSLTAGTVHSGIVGLDATRGEASMGDIALTVSDNNISAEFLMARAAATCAPGVSGSSELRNLVINGTSITVSGAPNQTITLANGTVIINEQSSTVGGTSAALTVNALHVTTHDTITQQELADVKLGTADSQIDCSGGSQPDANFGTGGGWIASAGSSGRANFGVMGGADNTGTKGHVVLHDQNGNFSMQSTTEAVDNTQPCETTITGTADSSQGIVSFTVTIRDNGEPGVDRDTFSILAGTYNNSALLGGGNIQKHGETCGS